MLNFGNKEFRNLQEQVLKNAQDIEALKNRPLLEIEIVDTLPETGNEGILYLVPVEDSSEGNLYEEYVWVNDTWEQVGSASIDLSNYATLDGDNEFTGDNTFDNVVVGDITTENIMPVANGESNIGSAAKKYEAGYINTLHSSWKVETPRLQSTTDDIAVISTAENATVYLYPDVDGKLALGKSNKRISTVYASAIANDFSALSIRGKSGVSITCDNGSDVKPSTDAQLTLGTATSRWKTLHLSHYVTWGNNVLIGKDASNRFYVTDSSGNTKIKVGVNETYFANHVEPDTNNNYDLGRSGVYWRNAYIKNIVDGDGTSIATNSLVTKPDYANPDVFESGTLNASGQGTIDMTQTGVPGDGLYMFTYNNCQCFLSLTSTMIQNASSAPIRCPCPTMYNGSAYPGILKIERAADVLTLTVATAGVGNVTPAGFGWQLIKVM